ncbi:MAG: IS21 family transposase [Bacteroidales bacterium]|nr:IS21 family transposase [Bacteroidales bacterium]
MPNKPISMTKIRQVLRCYAAGKGSKTIGKMLGMSRTTVKKYLQIYLKCGKSYEEIISMEDSALHSLFQEQEKMPKEDVISPRHQELQKLLPSYLKRLKKRGTTRMLLYRDYCKESVNPYSRSQFMFHLNTYEIISNPIAHIEHKAGDKMYVDYAGDKLKCLLDRDTGEVVPCELFISILSCSNLTYCEAQMSQRKEDFIQGCENSLRFYDGCPAAIVPDNLKSAVTRPGRYESELNEDFASFAEHHGCTIMPARVRKPKDKALVEDAVKLLYQRIYTKLDGRVFYDIESLNKAIWVELELHNNAPMTGGRPSRRSQYEELEREAMGPLNPIRFELKKRRSVTVQRNGYIGLEKSFYSVPTKYIRRKLNVMYDSQRVKIYSSSHDLIAEHRRSYKLFEYVTNPEHLPKNQRQALTWDPSALLQEASELHPDVESYMKKVILEKKYPEQAFKSCRGILSLARKVGVERLLKACRLAAASGMYNYLAVEDILKNQQDMLPEEEWSNLPDNVELPEHENVRGKEYYK